MPNHIYNVVTFDCPHERASEILQAVEMEGCALGSIDFEKLIPMPDDVYRGALGMKEMERYPGDKNWYNTWKKHFNRNVKRGEKGLRIIAPMPVTVEKEQDRIDQYGNTYKEKVQVTIPRFHAVTVFDVSQTEGEPLPDISPSDLKAEVSSPENSPKRMTDALSRTGR